ncbi:SIR2 family protein [Stenotrophomonas maltophilia]|uniref:SIR2 family protein n=1 Tax=Stenotrophomonas maltophilia TaxID=40324 RepID=UPI0018D3A1D6|nr:SIR2 family protein [Stenotrophomonas maltophilia]MBH1535414.1 SIR2 family protein [Stenotrophomonas maltophilia]
MSKLGQILKHPDAVIFVGSGISLWAGLPSWPGLLQELRAYLERLELNTDLLSEELGRGSLLQAASYGFDKLSKSQIGDFVRSACRLGVAEPHDIHRKIVALGPRCFITTNYDDLLEQALRATLPKRNLRIVTNRQLTEMADIVHARASDFLFKLHGDAGDSDSIILTKEQYRQLLPHGERSAALEALKTILVSRPVLYLGFGLRDPDFGYVKDIISNTYRGGEREHYAVLPDVSGEEVDYWRRNYGLNLVGYKTTINASGGRDHSALLKLIDESINEHEAAHEGAAFNPRSPSVVLALARHALNMSRSPKIEPEIPILAVQRNEENRWAHYGRPLNRILQEPRPRAIVCGLPGAGKTYALKRSAAELAEALHTSSMEVDFDPLAAIIPVFVDLKLYRGSLADLISDALPPVIQFPAAANSMRFCIYLDSFNEMPREYLDDGAFLADFLERIGSVSGVSVVIGSRTLDGLEKFECPVFDLDDIDRDYVTSALQEMDVDPEGGFFEELLQLFRKPFYFQLLSAGEIEIPESARPKDIYESLLRDVEVSVETRFEITINLRAALSVVAYDAVDEGLEAFESRRLAVAISREMRRSGESKIDPVDVVNWLVSKSLIIPHPKGLISFVHQSVTEYLAAFELARIFSVTPSVLDAKLEFHRWDQALFLTLGMLDSDAARDFTSKVFLTDFVLAINASKYVEYGKVELISKLLQEIIDRDVKNFDEVHAIAYAFERGIVASDAHLPLLRRIMQKGDSIGGVAASKILQILGSAAKHEVLEQVYCRPGDYNFCANGVNDEFLRVATEGDVRDILNFIENSGEMDDDEDEISGVMRLGSALLGEMEISAIRRFMGNVGEFVKRHPNSSRIVCEALWSSKTTDALALAGEMLLLGANGAVVALSFVVGPDENRVDLDWSSLGTPHAEILWGHVLLEDHWALRVLRCQCAARLDVRNHVISLADTSKASVKAALAYVCSDDDVIFEVFESLIAGENLDDRMVSLVQGMHLDWKGRESTLLGLLRLRNHSFAMNIIDSLRIGPGYSGMNVDIGDVKWWLIWMSEVDDFMFRDRLGGFLANCGSKESLDLFLDELSVANSDFKNIIINNILVGIFDLTTDQFSRDAIDYLIEDVQVNRSWRGHLLGAIATERFVEGRMLPLLAGSTGRRAELLRMAIRQAGDRLGRRYDLDGVPWS